MDTRNGNLYASRDAAIEAGVPEDAVAMVDTTHEGGVITIANGPFKGRRYEAKPDGTPGRRLRDAEPEAVRR